MKWDLYILSDQRFIEPQDPDWYVQQVLTEEHLLQVALELLGLKVKRVDWNDSSVDWSVARAAIFRSTWDYFDRYDEFLPWFESTSQLTTFINPYSLLKWNMDKNYLNDLQSKGIAVVPSEFIERGDTRSLSEVLNGLSWEELILKPCVSGCARHTYRFLKKDVSTLEDVYSKLVAEERMMLQEYQESITTAGEVSHMVMGGRYTHSILKKAKSGDFRVQDDFGGSVHTYEADLLEVAFAEKTFAACDPVPLYGRVDVMWGASGELLVSELEIIEPELWFRYHPPAATLLATAINDFLSSTSDA